MLDAPVVDAVVSSSDVNESGEVEVQLSEPLFAFDLESTTPVARKYSQVLVPLLKLVRADVARDRQLARQGYEQLAPRALQAASN